MSKQYFLYGAGGVGRRAFKQLKDLNIITGVMDNDPKKVGTKLGNFTIQKYDKATIGDCGVIIGFFEGAEAENELRKDRISYYRLADFYTDWFWKTQNRNAIAFLDLPITSRCTLMCKHCMQYLPLRGAGTDVPLGVLMTWWDSLLVKFPQIMEVSIMGGEPFLHPDLGQIIEHIYKSTNISIVVTTNGMVLPNNAVIDKLKQCGVFVSISDYSKTLPGIAEKVNAFEHRLKQNEIKTERKTHLWIDQGKFCCDNSGMPDDCARTHFQLADNKLWYCTLQCAGHKAGLCEATCTTDYLDLDATYSPDQLHTFSGNETKTTVCDRCGSRQRRRVPVAEQG